MIILGIDPGTALMGYSVLKKQGQEVAVLDFGCVETDKGQPDCIRLKKIWDSLRKIIVKHRPDIMAVESLFFFKNLKTVMPVSQAKGVALLCGADQKVPVLEFTPLQVKMAVSGYGRAEKKQVQEMTKKILDLRAFDLKENNRKKDDAYDALAVALCAAYTYMPLLVKK